MSEFKKNERFGGWLLAAGLVLAVAALLIRGRYEGAAPMEHAADSPPPSSIRGTPAAALDLPDVDGNRVRLGDYKNKVVLVNFWGTTCEPCMTEIPWLVEFQKKYGPQGLQVVAISMYGESPDVLKPYIAEHQMGDFKVVVGTAETPDLFGGMLGLPTTYVVDRDGRYFSKHQGLIDRAAVESELLTLLNQTS